MQKTCSRLLVTLVLLSVISITAQVAHATSSLGDNSGGATVGSILKPVAGQASSEPDSPSKTPPSVPALSMVPTSNESPSGMAMRGFDRVWWISRIWAALYLRVIK